MLFPWRVGILCGFGIFGPLVSCPQLTQGRDPRCRGDKFATIIYFGTTPHPVTVTTRIIPFLVGNPYKPSFLTVTGWGGRPNIYLAFGKIYRVTVHLNPNRSHPFSSQAHSCPRGDSKSHSVHKVWKPKTTWRGLVDKTGRNHMKPWGSQV